MRAEQHAQVAQAKPKPAELRLGGLRALPLLHVVPTHAPRCVCKIQLMSLMTLLVTVH